MSIYAELPRGLNRGISRNNQRVGSIFRSFESRLNRRKEDKGRINFYNRRKNGKRGTWWWNANKKDAGFEKHKLSEEQRKRIEDLEKELEEEEEKLSMRDEELEKLRKEALLVENQEFHVEENGVDHNTDEFDCVESGEQLVVRRGQEFKLTLTFQRPWDSKQDDMYLVFKLGGNPSMNRGTMAKIKLEEGNNTSYKNGPVKEWGARILKKEGNSLTVAVYSPPKAVIGEWEFAIRTEKTGGPKRKVYQCVGKDDVIILFNPWCHDDQVFMEKTQDLKEYVENENGMVFYGTSRSLSAKPWIYGQFQENILEISLHLLRKAFDYEISKKMSNPVQVSRALSRIVNDCDDGGVLSGNWSGNYENGTSPLSWKGSVPILEQYYEEKNPVKYGQCWVFSHVLTTVSRALGLPCRSVTNYSSAHDTNLSMTIDKYINDEGDIVKSRDSIWNFHVWNEVWMKRPDLDRLMGVDGKYDGWHAIDATPQERSDSLFQCGPSPLEAIRNGEMHVGYDTKFIFAEVNAEVCHWRHGEDEPILISHDSNNVGKFISTKEPNGQPMGFSFFGFDKDDRLDVTHLYKHPEGSVAEREAVAKALSDGELGKIIFDNVTGIHLEVLPTSPPKIGEDFTASVKIQNNAKEARSVRVNTIVRPMTYWGDVIGTRKIGSNLFSEVSLQPNESKTFETAIESERYLKECDAQLAMSVLAMGTVRGFDDHENRVYTSEDINVEGAKLTIQGPKDTVKAGETVTVEVKFTNPLKVELTGCVLSIQGPVGLEEDGFQKKHSVYTKKIPTIKVKESRVMQLNIRPNVRPKKSPDREFQVAIDCDQLPEIEGRCVITVRK